MCGRKPRFAQRNEPTSVKIMRNGPTPCFLEVLILRGLHVANPQVLSIKDLGDRLRVFGLATHVRRFRHRKKERMDFVTHLSMITEW